MFLRNRLAWWSAILGLFAFGTGSLSAETPVASPADQAARVDEIVRQAMDRLGIPGVSLAVVRDGRLVLAKGYGLANIELQVPAAPETVYQIQSITKSFTATGIMMLVEEGNVGLGNRLSTYLAGTPEAWKDITIRHLLTHTSGIKDFINEPTASLRLDVTEEEVLKATAPRPLNFQPGQRYAYSNTNYHLLAMIIRKVTGKSYGDFLRERIFEPLGMADTDVNILSAIVPRRASGYQIAADGWRNGELIAPSILAYGGGGLRSTVLDMARWDAALYTESVLKKATLEQMWTPATLNNGKTTNYGFGWAIQSISGHRCISHGGAHVTGFQTSFNRYVDDRLTVVVFSNCIGLGVDRLAQRVAGVYVPALAPPEYKLIDDQEPQIAEQLKSIYADWAAGRSDGKRFAPDLAKALKKPELQQLVQALGPMRALALVERKADGDVRRYRYRATFQRRQFLIVVGFDKDDLIADFRTEPE